VRLDSQPMGTEGKVKPASNLPLLRRLEAVSLVLAAVAMMANFVGLILVAGGAVVTFWAVSAMLLAVFAALRLVFWRTARSSDTTSLTGSVKLLRGVSAFAVGLSCCLAALTDSSATYRALDPAGANGCRAVVREHSFLFSGGGSVYAAPFGIGLRASSWTTDDGYEPVASGAYRLEWGGDSGVLELIGGIDPVWPSVHTIPCN
jgi:hypothetical protein